MERNICKSVSNEGLLTRIYKELSKPNSKKKNKKPNFEKWPKDLNTSSKKL